MLAFLRKFTVSPSGADETRLVHIGWHVLLQIYFHITKYAEQYTKRMALAQTNLVTN